MKIVVTNHEDRGHFGRIDKFEGEGKFTNAVVTLVHQHGEEIIFEEDDGDEHSQPVWLSGYQIKKLK